MRSPRNFPSHPKVAIVSDIIVQSGGAERVVEALAEAFPDAPIFTILYDRHRRPAAISSRIVQSWLKRLPNSSRLSKALMPLYPNAVESFDLRQYDVIVSSHHAFAKGILRNADQTHVCYCHSPMRALWERPHDEVQRAPALVRPVLKVLLQGLRSWDYAAASRVDHFVANSAQTALRIMKHYRRESVVLYPPIDTDHFRPGGLTRNFYLAAARNVPYKRIDLAIAAAERLQRRLIVVGENTDKLATPSPFVTYLGKVSDHKLLSLMQEARALFFPQHEDFGMTVLEMNACGRPVIAYGRGGALETVVDGVTGTLFYEQTVDSLANAIERFETLSFSPSDIRRHAEKYSKQNFIAQIHQIVHGAYSRESIARGNVVEPYLVVS